MKGCPSQYHRTGIRVSSSWASSQSRVTFIRWPHDPSKTPGRVTGPGTVTAPDWPGCIINLNLYECPPPWQNAEGDDNSYISRIASSGPLHMHSYLASCDWTLTKDTSEEKHILFKPDYEDKLKEQVAEAFTRPRPAQTFQPPTRHHPPQRQQSRPHSKKRRQDDSYTANSSASQSSNWNHDRPTLSWQQHSWSSWQQSAGRSSSSNLDPSKLEISSHDPIVISSCAQTAFNSSLTILTKFHVHVSLPRRFARFR